jgi:hypothetical protein
VADNTATFGGGVFVSGATRTIVTSDTVIAGNRASDRGTDCDGSLTATTSTFIGVTTDCATGGLGVIHSGVADLGPLQDNGGPTLTHEPTASSPLVDAADGAGPTADQRGLPRPSGAAADFGAVERQETTQDTSAPTWVDGTLGASELTATSVRLTWSGATDDVGVTGYEISADGSVIATAGAATVSTVITGLAPETLTRFVVQALDAAGNRSTDGPGRNVTTPALPPTGHVGPAGATTDLAWMSDLPFALLETAGRTGEVVLVASAGAHPQVRVLVAPASPASLDLDGDGIADIRAAVVPQLLPFGLELDITRLATPGPADVEVIAGMPVGLLSGELPSHLVVGFRTLDSAGGPGGTVPDRVRLATTVDVPVGLDHEIGVTAHTENPDGPLLFLAGGVDGSERVGAGAANVLGMTVGPVPSRIDLSAVLSLTDIGDEPDVDLAFAWSSPEDETRPVVTFAYGERERVTAGPAEQATVVRVDPMAPATTLRIRLNPADAAGREQATVRVEGATLDMPIDELALEHRRVDGLAILGGFRDLEEDLQLAIDDAGTLRISDGHSSRTRMFIELQHPGRDFLGGAFSRPMDHLFASFRDRTAATEVLTDATLSPSKLRIGASGYSGGELILIATNGISDLRLPTPWPQASPRAWSYDSLGNTSRHTRVALVDDGERVTLALHAIGAGGLTLDLDPVVLSQVIEISTQGSASDLRILLDAAAGTPVGGPQGTTMQCQARLQPGDHSVVIDPAGRYGYAGPGTATQVDCTGARGRADRRVQGGTAAARVTIEIVDVEEAAGALPSASTIPPIPSRGQPASRSSSTTRRATSFPTGSSGARSRTCALRVTTSGRGVPSGPRTGPERGWSCGPSTASGHSVACRPSWPAPGRTSSRTSRSRRCAPTRGCRFRPRTRQGCTSGTCAR